ncbi:nuclear speckle splicing regulatory protein 1 [Chrysoperla carnea]|uniref:nuclear speckle splicing regulatory protein 1 n=1 Tax=Chrysoperla carnea TaxID=189513 RepID=UPI001D078AAD|nr:nuclear speckle splicing regulatory protein 1 [Chrysoperla carnea]
MSKQYGLITSGKNSDSKPKVFGSDSDSGDDAEKNVPTAAQQNVIRRQDLIAQQKALEEDPTVYQYDEVYDEMDEKKKQSKLARKDVEKKPKYINRLLQSAARRKRENELRIERQVQKDRLAEGDTYKDKEEFVTSAYRKKLEELRELEEQEKREEYLEKIGDVTKQEDLGGFYRHLYEQKMKKDSDDDDNTSDKDKKKKASSDKSESEEEKTNDKKRSDSKSNKESKKETTKDRKYRKRDESESENSESENHSKQKRHLQSNLDADSDFSIESTDSEKEDKKSHQKEKIKKESNSDKEEKPIKKSKNDPPLEFEPESKKKSSNDDVKPPVIKKQKVDIWKKRTVGDVFDDALQRYYERKNARLNG